MNVCIHTHTHFFLVKSTEKKMAASSASKWVYLVCISLVLCIELTQCIVTYDKKSLIFNGQRRILFSGSIHYPRSTPQMWEDLIQKAKDGGLDVIDTYVFWNVHEPSPGIYNFEGRYDLVHFVKLVHKAGMYMHLRIGPFVCAEWNFGGFPVWLKYVPGISFRTDNEPFKMAMQKFTTKIVEMIKDEMLFESQGGPIILSQIENEYGADTKAYGAAGHAYMTWAAKMAVGLDTGVPWVMCKQDDAPDPILNTCNGFYCDYFSPNNKETKPTMWTEAWTGWFSDFGGPLPHRPVQDLAFAVARFIQKGGSFTNYYMYHGGTNFGRTAGGPFITTSYDYDAPIDEYGLVRQPKYDHLKELHKAIKLCEGAIVSADPAFFSLGSYEQAHVFSSTTGGCAAFLANYHINSSATVRFRNNHYDLPPWSISILPDCKNVAFNTAQVGSKTSVVSWLPTNVNKLDWQTFSEDVSSVDSDSKMTVFGLLDQLSVTRDASDYLWYSTSLVIDPSELHADSVPTITVQSEGHALHVFMNNELVGSAFGNQESRKIRFTGKANLRAGMNKIQLLSVAVGLQNNGPRFELSKTGVLGPVVLHGVGDDSRDITHQKWSYQIGLKGESKNLASPTGMSSVEWTELSLSGQIHRPLTWYKAYFNAPEGEEPLAIDMNSMGKGQVWINGESIGRYWTINAKGSCSDCNYAGTFRPVKCQTQCGEPTQRWYHIPRSWLKPTQNLMVVFEEIGGDASAISIMRRSLR